MWKTHYRGELAIHAGLGTQYLTKRELKEYPTGCVIAIANLVECIHLGSVINKLPSELNKLVSIGIDWELLLKHPHAEGPYCWILKDVRAIEPVPARGAQQLWEWNNG